MKKKPAAKTTITNTPARKRGRPKKTTTPAPVQPTSTPTPTVPARPTIQLPLVLDVPVDLILAALAERLKK